MDDDSIDTVIKVEGQEMELTTEGFIAVAKMIFDHLANFYLKHAKDHPEVDEIEIEKTDEELN